MTCWVIYPKGAQVKYIDLFIFGGGRGEVLAENTTRKPVWKSFPLTVLDISVQSPSQLKITAFVFSLPKQICFEGQKENCSKTTW